MHEEHVRALIRPALFVIVMEPAWVPKPLQYFAGVPVQVVSCPLVERMLERELPPGTVVSDPMPLLFFNLQVIRIEVISKSLTVAIAQPNLTARYLYDTDVREVFGAVLVYPRR